MRNHDNDTVLRCSFTVARLYSTVLILVLSNRANDNGRGSDGHVYKTGQDWQAYLYVSLQLDKEQRNLVLWNIEPMASRRVASTVHDSSITLYILIEVDKVGGRQEEVQSRRRVACNLSLLKTVEQLSLVADA